MPRKRTAGGAAAVTAATRFNEAGALCPGKGHQQAQAARPHVDASMRPGLYAPEKAAACNWHVNVREASMRPGLYAPEKASVSFSLGGAHRRFNEAGALCPGKADGGLHLLRCRGALQ